MDRVDRLAGEAEADREAWLAAEAEAAWNAFLEREQGGRADLEAGT